MFVVDASVWVAALFRPDQFHIESRAWLDSLRGRDGQAAPLLILPEVAGAVARRSGRPTLGHRARTWLQALPDLMLYTIDGDLAERAAAAAADLGLAGADAVYLALAEALDVPLVTWDSGPLERAAPRARTPIAAGPS
jgi:predicted nucleic acid-binding protein